MSTLNPGIQHVGGGDRAAAGRCSASMPAKSSVPTLSMPSTEPDSDCTRRWAASGIPLDSPPSTTRPAFPSSQGWRRARSGYHVPAWSSMSGPVPIGFSTSAAVSSSASLKEQCHKSAEKATLASKAASVVTKREHHGLRIGSLDLGDVAGVFVAVPHVGALVVAGDGTAGRRALGCAGRCRCGCGRAGPRFLRVRYQPPQSQSCANGVSWFPLVLRWVHGRLPAAEQRP